MLQARLLGQYEIRMDDRPVIISSRPAQSLFAYLLLHPNRAHRREKLAGQFWPAASEANARSNLRHALWRIRKALGAGAKMRLEGDDLGIAYHPQPGDLLDVDSLQAGDDASSTDALLMAVSAYGGELLPGFYEEWVMLERERLQAAYERMLTRLLDRLLLEKRWEEALEWGERWIAAGGVPEPAYRALMLAHAGLGNLAGAAAQYQRCVEALARELGVEPSERTRQTFEKIRDGGVETALPSFKSIPSAIPCMPAFLEGPQKPAPIFVGREAELSALDGYLEKALQGQAQIVFVNGEAGSGKSALLQAFMRRSLAAHPDLAMGWAICNAFFGQGDPFLPFRDVLNVLAGGIETLYSNGAISQEAAQHLSASFPLVVQALLEQGPGLINTFLGGSTLASRLAAFLPGEQFLTRQIAELATPGPGSIGEHDRSQLFEQYTQVLYRIAQQRPLLLFLDDLQWMDPGSGRLLFHLVRRLQDTRLLIAGAYRPEEVALDRNGERHALEPLLHELQSSFGEISVDLDRAREISGRDFIDALLDSEPNRLGEAFRQELYHRTQGHPFFTIQLLRTLQERREILSDKQGRWIASPHLNWDTLPPQVEGIIGERIGRLDRELQDLLLAASVEGEQFTVQVLERVQATPPRVILRQLSRELEKRHRLVQELGEIRVAGQRLARFRFTHALIQQYMYRRLGAAERAVLHREIAETLETLYKEDVAAIALPLARHYRQAGVGEKAVEYLLQAGDQARSLYALPEAIDHYQHALAHLEQMGDTDQTARTLMKLYLVYHSSFDFQRAQQALEECNHLWQQLAQRNVGQTLPLAQKPYRLPILKEPVFDPALIHSLFQLEWIKGVFCGLVEWSEDRNLVPLAAKHWDVLNGGRRYVFHLRDDILWSDGQPVTAEDFEFAWKRALDPATQSLSANLLYDILGARDFHQGRAGSSEQVGISAPNPLTLVVDLEEPCGYFPYILGDPISFPVPKHVVEREGSAWTEPARIVTNGPFRLENWDHTSGKTYGFSRNPRYFGRFEGNIERVELVVHQSEQEIYQSFVAGEVDKFEFLLPQFPQDELKRFRQVGQLSTSPVPFVDAVYFVTDRPPFDNPDVRRAIALATDREKLARQIEYQLPATGGYLPPGLPGHSPENGLPYDPHEARRILARAGYPQGRGFPPVNMVLGLVGLEKGDDLVFALLQEMWRRDLGITVQKCWGDSPNLDLEAHPEFNLFFTGWLADFPDPAPFLERNFLIDQSHWHDPAFEALLEEGRHSLDQARRVELYRQADRILTQEAVVMPLFYGRIYELRQPWLQRPAGSSIYSLQWKDTVLMPH